jgi:hypothetical protein
LLCRLTSATSRSELVEHARLRPTKHPDCRWRVATRGFSSRGTALPEGQVCNTVERPNQPRTTSFPVPAPRTDRLRGACVVRPTDCKSVAGELISRAGLLLRPGRIITTVSRSSIFMDARLSGRPATLPRLSVGSALSGQGFAFCDVVASALMGTRHDNIRHTRTFGQITRSAGLSQHNRRRTV